MAHFTPGPVSQTRVSERPSTQMKVIFLDFDGILFSLRSNHLLEEETNYTNGVNPDWPAIRTIRRKCKIEGWKIQPSSTWMKNPEMATQILREIGLDDYLCPEWNIGENAELYKKPSENISKYLEKNPQITDWLILEDIDYEWTDEQKKHWIKGCMFDGLSTNSLQRISLFPNTETNGKIRKELKAAQSAENEFMAEMFELVADYGLQIDLSASGEILELHSLNLPEKFRGQGIGSRILNSLIQTADKHQVPIELEIGEDEAEIGLMEFYSRRQFVALDGYMRREPRKEKHPNA